LLAVMAFFASPGLAFAQVKVTQVPASLNAVRGSLGWPATSASEADGWGVFGNLAYERRVGRLWNVRFQAQHSAWDMTVEPTVTSATRMSVSAVMLGIVKSADGSGPLQPYVGGGIGAYRYAFRPEQIGSVARPGFFFLGGLQYPRRSAPYAAFFEFQFSVVGGPKRAQIQEYYSLNLLSFSIGLKASF
jgi:hypothetical protein